MSMILDPSGRPADVAMTPREHPLAPGAHLQPEIVEVVRSFSFKLNLGNYQSADFFCSQKAQCERPEADQVSTDLYEWCYDQVMDAVKDVQRKQAAKQAQRERSAA